MPIAATASSVPVAHGAITSGAAGWDIGSGMVEAACRHLIGAREKGPGMRWSEAGAQRVAAVRVLLFNAHWTTYDLAA